MTTAWDVIESFGYKPERTDEEILKLLHDRGVGRCGRSWRGIEFALTPTHVYLDLGAQRRTVTHEELLREYREQIKGANEMTNEFEMKVTFVDPEGRSLFVGEEANGRFAIFAQRGKNARRRLQSKWYNPEKGYETYDLAMKDLGCYVSSKRAEGATYYKWDVYVNGRHVTFDEYDAICRHEIAVPGTVPPDAPVALANIEYRIAVSVQGAYENILEVGRCLNEAKDAGLVPHGEWEGWVRKNTGMSERNAQRLMQAARSVDRGSMMERLPISKIQAILALPEPEREPMAQKAVEENLTVKELRRRISDLNAKSVQQEQSLNQLRYDKGQESARVQQLQNQLQAQLTNNATLDGLRKEAETRANALRLQLEEALKQPATGISAEAQAKIDSLSADLEDALREIAEQAQLRMEAQEQLLNAAMTGGGIADDERRGFGPEDLAAAVRAFMGAAGVMVHMGAELSRLSAGTKAEMRHQVEMIGAWAQGAARALDTETLVVEG